MILCACGCGEKKVVTKDGRIRGKYIYGHHKLGKHLSEETKLKISLKLKNVPKSESHKKHLSDIHKGKFSGEKSPHWKGGSKISNAVQRHKRRQRGFIPLNSPDVDGWVAHHLDYNYVIYIPEELHKSVWHSVVKNINMDKINDKVHNWVINYYFGELA